MIQILIPYFSSIDLGPRMCNHMPIYLLMYMYIKNAILKKSIAVVFRDLKVRKREREAKERERENSMWQAHIDRCC